MGEVMKEHRKEESLVNACIVGFGAIGPIHAEAIKKLKNVNIYAICDICKERADHGAAEYGAKAYYDFYECIKDDNIDCIHICTPHYLHFEMIKKSLEANKKVVVEKPAIMKKDEMDILFSNYDVSNIFPIVQNRKNECILKLKSIIENDKTIGRLKGIKGILTWRRDSEYYNSANWRGTKEYEGGGVLINQAIHTLDLMVYIGGAIEEIKAKMSNYSLENIIEVEDTVDAFMRFKNKAVGIFYVTNAYSDNSSVDLEVHFENKHFRYIDGMLLCDGEIVCKDSDGFIGKVYWGIGHVKTLADYYEYGTTFNLSDVKDTMDAMFAAYESAQMNGKPVHI